MKGWLVVFAKAPQPGRVKTRLSPPLSSSEAAELYRCLLLDAFEESAAAAAALRLETVVAVDPPSATAELAALSPAGFRAIAQSAGELGTRMSHVVRQAAAAGAPFVLLRGSDSPCLNRDLLQDAVVSLTRADLVICPDRDGGYNLIGLGPRGLSSGPTGGLFDHPMSTPFVLGDTLARANRIGLSSDQLEGGFDVDRYEDLRWLAAARDERRSIPCRRTLTFLDDRQLWPSARAPQP